MRMQSVVKSQAAPGMDYVESEVPRITPKEVLVKVQASSICGTDLHIWEWNHWAARRIRPPQIIGHEFAGEVVEVGADVDSIQVGDYISADSHIPCGRCFQCKTGQSEVCRHVRILGVDQDGCFADYVAVSEVNAWKNDKCVPPALASMQDPLGNAVDTVLAEDVAGKTVLVTGCGPIGVMAVGVARISGATEVIATDVNTYRLELARKMGATRVLNPTETSVNEEILEMTHGVGVDVVLEISGNPAALHQGFKALRPGGRVSLLGLLNRPETIDVNDEIIFKGARVYGITGRKMFSTWYKSTRFLASGLLDLTPLITHKFALKDFARGMELMKQGDCGKVILFPDGADC